MKENIKFNSISRSSSKNSISNSNSYSNNSGDRGSSNGRNNDSNINTTVVLVVVVVVYCTISISSTLLVVVIVLTNSTLRSIIIKIINTGSISGSIRNVFVLLQRTVAVLCSAAAEWAALLGWAEGGDVGAGGGRHAGCGRTISLTFWAQDPILASHSGYGPGTRLASDPYSP